MDLVLLAIIIYAVANVVAMMSFVSDKNRAVRGEWRTPEKTLLFSALLGPFGAVAGMHLAHHKTKKPKFKLVYLFVVIHIIVIAVLFLRPF